jgi:hypothetical protein
VSSASDSDRDRQAVRRTLSRKSLVGRPRVSAGRRRSRHWQDDDDARC